MHSTIVCNTSKRGRRKWRNSCAIVQLCSTTAQLLRSSCASETWKTRESAWQPALYGNYCVAFCSYCVSSRGPFYSDPKTPPINKGAHTEYDIPPSYAHPIAPVAPHCEENALFDLPCPRSASCHSMIDRREKDTQSPKLLCFLCVTHVGPWTSWQCKTKHSIGWILSREWMITSRRVTNPIRKDTANFCKKHWVENPSTSYRFWIGKPTRCKNTPNIQNVRFPALCELGSYILAFSSELRARSNN